VKSRRGMGEQSETRGAKKNQPDIGKKRKGMAERKKKPQGEERTRSKWQREGPTKRSNCHQKKKRKKKTAHRTRGFEGVVAGWGEGTTGGEPTILRVEIRGEKGGKRKGGGRKK